MDERDWLAERFEQERPRLRGVAYRMLGSLSEADDAVQEAWLRLSRTNATDIDNLGGLDMQPALVNGVAGGVAIRDGEPFAIGSVIVRGGKIVAMDFLADPERLRQIDLTILDS